MQIARRGLAALMLTPLAQRLARPALAQSAWPERPIRLVVPFGAGGNLDTLIRIVSPSMSQRLGQPVVVENRPGAGGNLGTENVARAAPDGYSILVGSNGALVNNPLLMARLPFDPARDFAPIGLGFRTPNVLVVAPRFPAQTLPDFVAYAKARPGQVACASAGTGTTNHLLIELLNAATGAGLLHVPYRSSGAATPDMLSGALASSMDQITTALPQHRDGALKMIGIGLPERLASLPEVASFAEVGLENGGLTSFIGLLAPAGTPAGPIAKIQAAFSAALADPALRQRIEAIGNLIAKPEEQTPEGFNRVIESERILSRRAVQLAGLKPE
ncbi:tripartite tricarboxylate transporter substrate binding protein [Siccirubricoccus sp. KC 17139]|uniref:Tripartite tricarboxylate transporter substrate binding protein n=1 Tax=Siccirubricoccus soli TaxID=2899147 RepID=A0ABT1D120_9PROT|nr:tripartite tricarboxylate transporter substrate binding protein [Siccirubricoccus soli]MCO6415610.1 tripartite tricarboxylate transporter substrate binding protein [Siccirubricoccus soli]MCP2681742.1 tripartite tricarboxylate transporter substrate binding protein [Siccirubricoccus soli]